MVEFCSFVVRVIYFHLGAPNRSVKARVFRTAALRPPRVYGFHPERISEFPPRPRELQVALEISGATGTRKIARLRAAGLLAVVERTRQSALYQ